MISALAPAFASEDALLRMWKEATVRQLYLECTPGFHDPVLVLLWLLTLSDSLWVRLICQLSLFATIMAATVVAVWKRATLVCNRYRVESVSTSFTLLHFKRSLVMIPQLQRANPGRTHLG